jgi:hypothetical protein
MTRSSDNGGTMGPKLNLGVTPLSNTLKTTLHIKKKRGM